MKKVFKGQQPQVLEEIEKWIKEKYDEYKYIEIIVEIL